MLFRILKLAALATVVATAQGTWVKRNDEPSWQPARKTGKPTETASFSPKPTEAPGSYALGNDLQLRGIGNTCGYLAGYSSSAIITCTGSSTCGIETDYRIMGCCPAGIFCDFVTRCYDYTQSDSASIDEGAAWCSDSRYPYCAPITFDHNDASYAGYSNFDYCMATQVPTRDAFFRASDAAAASTGSSVPIGPIVGGVVGGVVLIAIVAIAVFFILRSKKKSRAGAVAQTYAANPAPQPYSPFGAASAPVPESAVYQPPKSEYGPNVNVAPVPQAPFNPQAPPGPGFPGNPASHYPGNPTPGNPAPHYPGYN